MLHPRFQLFLKSQAIFLRYILKFPSTRINSFKFSSIWLYIFYVLVEIWRQLSRDSSGVTHRVNLQIHIFFKQLTFKSRVYNLETVENIFLETTIVGKLQRPDQAWSNVQCLTHASSEMQMKDTTRDRFSQSDRSTFALRAQVILAAEKSSRPGWGGECEYLFVRDISIQSFKKLIRYSLGVSLQGQFPNFFVRSLTLIIIKIKLHPNDKTDF